MGKARHTPGPWRHREYRNKNGGIWIDCYAVKRGKLLGGTLAEAYADGCGDGDQEANARLIAAAPEMLAQLRGWLAIFTAGGAHVSPLVATAMKETAEIVRKAEGE